MESIASGKGLVLPIIKLICSHKTGMVNSGVFFAFFFSPLAHCTVSKDQL